MRILAIRRAMTEDHTKLSESVRSGHYFEEARAWYQAIYLSPVSGRTMFLIIALLAMVVCWVAILSLRALLPLTDRPGILISAQGRMDEVVPRLIPLQDKRMDPGEAVALFLARHYVVASEGWVPHDAENHAKFVKAYASDAVYAEFVNRINPVNPTSFAALHPGAQRRISIVSARVDTHETSGDADVRFIAETEGDVVASKSQWTAKLEYKYTALGIETIKNSETGAEEIKITDPHFQVVSYVVEQDR